MVYIEELRRSNPPPADSIEDETSEVPADMPGAESVGEGINAEE
jgi:hypothetical protein